MVLAMGPGGLEDGRMLDDAWAGFESPSNKQIRRALDEATAAFSEVERSALAAATVWSFGQLPARSLLPLDELRNEVGAPLPDVTSPADRIVQYGCGDDGTLWVAREYSMRKAGLDFAPTLYRYSVERIAWSTHEPKVGRQAKAVGWIDFVDGRPRQSEVLTAYRLRTERYRYEGERLVEILLRIEEFLPPRHTVISRMPISYAGDEVTAIDHVQGENTYVVYRRRPQGVTLRAASSRLVDALVRATTSLLPRDGEPVAAVALVYSGHPPLPPFVTCASASELAHGNTRWAFADWRRPLDVDRDADVREAAAHVSALAGADAWKVGIGILRRAAKQLRSTLASDCVVIACDYELMDLKSACRDAGVAP